MSQAKNPSDSQGPVIPDKLYFRIGEVARLLDVETHTLRFWEGEFPQLKVGKGGTGQRLYRRRDVELVLEIKQLLYQQGYTIPGARQFLQSRSRRKDHPPAVQTSEPQPRHREPRLEKLRSDLRDLSALLSDDAVDAAPEASAAKLRKRETSGPAPHSSRRGLHIASRLPEKTSAHRTLPGLFDSESD